HCRAQRSHRLRRAARDRADDPPDASRRLPAVRISARARDARSHRRPVRDEGDARALPRPDVGRAARRVAGLSVPDPAGLPHLARLESLGQRGIRLGLEAIDAVCERLGRPERTVPSVLVAGTNGKGSTAATFHAIAGAAGLSAGLYTSPHLERVTERLRIGPDDVGPDELDAALGEVFAAADRAPAIPLTYFEAVTGAAFLAFARGSLDLALLEVGMGG